MNLDELRCQIDQIDQNLLQLFEQRMEIVKAIRYVDEVILEESWDQKVEDVKKYNIDTFVMGDDWKGQFDFLEKYCNVVYLPRTKGISTTQLKQGLSQVK